jgi:hypothetical protein
MCLGSGGSSQAALIGSIRVHHEQVKIAAGIRQKQDL